MEYFFKAVEFATRAHHNQRRKSSTDPYMVHPLRVGYLALDSGLSEEAAAAAILHDVVEDCNVSFEELVAARFPLETVLIVQALTKWWDDGVSKEDKDLFKVQYYDIILNNADAVNVKILDRIDNLKDMMAMLPNKSKWVAKYIKKTEEEFPPLILACNNTAIKVAYDIALQALKQKLGLLDTNKSMFR